MNFLVCRDNFGYSPVMVAAYCSSYGSMDELLHHQGVDMDLLNWREETLEQIAEGSSCASEQRRSDVIDLIR